MLNPGWKRAAAEQCLCSPLGEVNRERDAVTIVSGEDQHVLAAGMAAENGAHAIGEKNWASPAVGDADGLQRRVQMMHAAFEPPEALGSFSFANIEAVQIRRSELL